jgi:hypothetical protein
MHGTQEIRILAKILKNENSRENDTFSAISFFMLCRNAHEREFVPEA